MKCQFCEQESSVTYTKVVGDKSQKIHLCSQCADDKGITNLENFDLTDMLMDDGQFFSEEENVSKNLEECPDCGFTLANLRKVGRLGCSSCYENFSSEVSSMIGAMHKGTEHKGKVPEGMLKAIETKKQLNKLKGELKKAIADEDYEKAGKLKEELVDFKKTVISDEK